MGLSVSDHSTRVFTASDPNVDEQGIQGAWPSGTDPAHAPHPAPLPSRPDCATTTLLLVSLGSNLARLKYSEF